MTRRRLKDLASRARFALAQRPRAVELALFLVAAVLTAGSAILVKESGVGPALAALEVGEAFVEPVHEVVPVSLPVSRPEPRPSVESLGPVRPLSTDAAPEIRYFNGRPIRPAGTVRMRVTAYSPDARSCGEHADGQTATLHSVTTNAGKLVAADTSLFPYGTLLSVPGYDEGRVVPVLDCGGAIKGRRLDVLYPTHKAARQWGVQDLDVVVWEYADGKPADDPRELR